MKAITYYKYGAPSELRLEEVEKPSPKDNEVLVKVCASSINSWDWDLLTGKPLIYRLMFGLFKPKFNIIGGDIAGIVQAVGKDVKTFKVGDRVFGDISGRWGGFAEYVCAEESTISMMLTEMTFDQAAAIPHTAVLAWQSVHFRRTLQQNHKLLIIGAGGGVGTFALQMAKAIGAEVTCVDKEGKFELLRSLGADHCIDYRNEDFSKNEKKYDLIIDVIARRSIFTYRRSLTSTGHFAMVGGKISSILQAAAIGPFISMFTDRKMGLVIHQPNKPIEQIKELFAQRKLVPIIDSTYSLSDIPQAMMRIGNGDSKGKIIIRITS